MRIDKIEIENFKLFDKVEFSFNEHFNLIIGINGSGKSSLLRALAVALGGWANAYIKDDRNLRPIEKNEIREIQKDGRFDKTKDTLIKTYGEARVINRYSNDRKANVEWTRRRQENQETSLSGSIQYENPADGTFSTWYSLNFNTLGSDILNYVDKGRTFDLPLIAVYECDRLWLAKNQLNIEASAKAQYSRFDPYVDCFHTGANHEAIGEWLLKHELASLQLKEETPVLLSIKNAVRNALENCTDISFDFEEGRVIVDFEDKSIPFEHLSDGQRTILGLFCDIARRAAILNPHFGGEASENTSGVVLIDELDLHLHPKWQMKIIGDLQKVFPNIQFICTTHSPILLRSIEKEKIIVLEDGKQSQSEIFSKGRDINSILYDFMGVPKRTQEYEDKVDNLFGFLDDENIERAEELLTELKKDYGERDAIVIEAQTMLDVLKP
ncbi:AAA family ATPase [Sulfurospirillum deleyianum]|uniref:SMC domain protein n=1 Tax=Sulfurospirillum deleyianum (strain ATCC 51133 / DSM 6946 / 5175) TaxID=525898 RepID=D1B0S6_SULD5|nr:AAA family ATPase [Sulfurospirillum deleyianum]ACZ11070.1 SMC domain protein [Sulfurospirillum deleyianum DSM 6946]